MRDRLLAKSARAALVKMCTLPVLAGANYPDHEWIGPLRFAMKRANWPGVLPILPGENAPHLSGLRLVEEPLHLDRHPPTRRPTVNPSSNAAPLDQHRGLPAVRPPGQSIRLGVLRAMRECTGSPRLLSHVGLRRGTCVHRSCVRRVL